MLNKLIALMLVFSVFTVQTHASTNDGLKAAFDELDYALTVEWDQRDKDFHTEQLRKFTAAMRELQAKGLTNAQLVDFAKSQVKNAQVAKDLETAFNMIQINKMSPAEANKYILDTMKKSYSVGASWNGEVFIYLAVGVMIVALAIAIANSAYDSHHVANCANNDVLVCDHYCYNDYFYGYYCAEDCYFENQYNCN